MIEAGSPVLIAMCGIPFAGKTTLAMQIAAHGRMHLLRVDATVGDARIDIGTDGRRGIGWARSIAQTFQRVRPLLVAGESVVFDHANHTRVSRNRCRMLASESGARFAGIWVDVDPAIARNRLLTNRDSLVRSDVPDASFRQIVEEFDPPLNEPDVVRWCPDMTVDDLMRAIQWVEASDP